MNVFIQEIVDAHIAIENWLGRGEGELASLMARFAADFSMIAPTGACLDYASLTGFFQAQRGSRPGLKIVVDDFVVLAQWDNGAVIRYRETQGENVRGSTAVFRLQEGQIVWRHLHETALGK
ncbi:hypothetical protein [Enterobacter sp. Bisph1]|uniref:hypothetical protein n=1 Tax=Enterobacter sp. Bisph1 TaxID=1274399 RepID=UPI00057C00B8|nr:hypothetical protein [Enterobacter sp. Bisph1]